MLNRDVLPSQTRCIFDLLAKDARLSDFILIGGTALALQKGHRLSEDLDFWLPATALNKNNIAGVMATCVENGVNVRLATPHSKIIAAKINGLDLLSGVQDYVLDGVKVTFLARFDETYQRFAELERISNKGQSFAVMGGEGIFTMKSHLIHCRTRSRDLFDLMTFAKDGKGIDEILQAGVDVDPAVSTEYAKSVLRGDVPMDKEDEGFYGVGIKESVSDVHQFFAEKIDEYEQRIATCRIKSLVPPGKYTGTIKIIDDQVVLHHGCGKEIHFNLNGFSQQEKAAIADTALKYALAAIHVSVDGGLSFAVKERDTGLGKGRA